MSDLENSTLTLEEMILGVNKDELPRISIEDAEIVRRQYLSRIKEAVLTIMHIPPPERHLHGVLATLRRRNSDTLPDGSDSHLALV